MNSSPAIATLRVAIAGNVPDALSDGGQNRIAAEVTVGVVNRPEVIEVVHDEGKRRLLPMGTLLRLLDDISHDSPVACAGQSQSETYPG